MRLVHIRAGSDEDVTCLMRELAVYSPKHLQRTVVIELEERSQTDLLALLAAVETCLNANDIRSIRIELDGKKYTMAPAQLSR
jgi:xanthine dehydrogenase iron-sulfur cluster and FAD-binding subunit A